MRQRQQGMTMIGILFVLGLVGVIGYAGMRILPRVPELHEGRAQHGCHGLGIQRRRRRSGRAAPHAREALADRGHRQRRAAKDVEITKDDGGAVMHVAYDDSAPYIANVSLTVHFDKTAKVQ